MPYRVLTNALLSEEKGWRAVAETLTTSTRHKLEEALNRHEQEGYRLLHCLPLEGDYMYIMHKDG